METLILPHFQGVLEDLVEVLVVILHIQVALELRDKVILVGVEDLLPLVMLEEAAAGLELLGLVEQVLPLEVVLVVLDYQHFKETLEFLHLMELLDHNLEDILLVVAVDQKVVVEDLAEEVMEHRRQLQHLELQALPILVVEEVEQMLLTVLVEQEVLVSLLLDIYYNHREKL